MTSRPTVAIVTGASRGAGRGIARALGAHGCTVYVTGRSETDGDASMPGTIHATAAEVSAAGGHGIAVRCDHADDTQVAAMVDRVIAEQGRVDILVNNACAISDALMAPGGFWEKPLTVGRMIEVGIYSGFSASWHVAPHMVRQGRGLILFTSSPGSMHYCFGPAYGAHKAAVDKMAFDMGTDFADAGVDVAAVSVWMGSLATERLLGMIEAEPDKYGRLRDTLEMPDYTGHVAFAMFSDPDMMRWNGRTVIGAEAGRDYGIRDAGDRFPPFPRDGTGASPPVFAPYKVK